MKAYYVKVNGKDYFVEIEEALLRKSSPAPVFVKDTPTSATPSAAQVPPATSFAEPASGAPIPAPVPAAQGAAVQLVTSPLPGTVLSVDVQVGEAVKKGGLLFTIEAMKMENEIIAAKDGIVTQIKVVKGTTVDTGDVLLVM